ncbi:MAG: hypothetical protein WBW31_02185, partial [Candidatus Sulfotelmatobacter sp.]
MPSQPATDDAQLAKMSTESGKTIPHLEFSTLGCQFKDLSSVPTGTFSTMFRLEHFDDMFRLEHSTQCS